MNPDRVHSVCQVNVEALKRVGGELERVGVIMLVEHENHLVAEHSAGVAHFAGDGRERFTSTLMVGASKVRF